MRETDQEFKANLCQRVLLCGERLGEEAERDSEK